MMSLIDYILIRHPELEIGQITREIYIQSLVEVCVACAVWCLLIILFYKMYQRKRDKK